MAQFTEDLMILMKTKLCEDQNYTLNSCDMADKEFIQHIINNLSIKSICKNKIKKQKIKSEMKSP